MLNSNRYIRGRDNSEPHSKMNPLPTSRGNRPHTFEPRRTPF